MLEPRFSFSNHRGEASGGGVCSFDIPHLQILRRPDVNRDSSRMTTYRRTTCQVMGRRAFKPHTAP